MSEHDPSLFLIDRPGLHRLVVHSTERVAGSAGEPIDGAIHLRSDRLAPKTRLRTNDRHSRPRDKTPLEIAQERHARGEIDRAADEPQRRDLGT
jgi:hypothetical protein